MSTEIQQNAPQSPENINNDNLIVEKPIDPEESKKRILTGWQWYVVAGIGVTASLFHLYTAAFGLFDAMTQRSWHWMFMGSLLFLLYPFSQKYGSKTKIQWFDWILAAALVFGCANILWNYEAIAMREGSAIPSDIYIGAMMIFLVIEGTRRSMGWPLPIMAIISLLYGLLGSNFSNI